MPKIQQSQNINLPPENAILLALKAQNYIFPAIKSKIQNLLGCKNTESNPQSLIQISITFYFTILTLNPSHFYQMGFKRQFLTALSSNRKQLETNGASVGQMHSIFIKCDVLLALFFIRTHSSETRLCLRAE